MIQGDAYSIRFKIQDSTGQVITDSMVDDVEIALGEKIKSYANGELTYSDNHWLYPISQQESFSIDFGLVHVQVRVKFTSGEVIGKDVGLISVKNSISKEIL